MVAPTTTWAGKGDKTAERKSATQAKAPAQWNLAKFDRNGNGTLDPEEKDAVRKVFATLAAFDTNQDGKLDDNELSTFQPTHQTAKKKQQAK